jgi:hypothetical protein
MKKVIITVSISLMPWVAQACPACFGSTDAAAAKGMNVAIYFLLGITLFVLGGFGGFTFYLWRMSKKGFGPTKEQSFEEVAQKHEPVRHTPLWHMQNTHQASGIHEPVAPSSISGGPRHHTRYHRNGDSRSR